MRVDADGRGIVSLLELPQLQDRPRLFSTFLMWLLADLFQDLPEVGDVDKPKLVFFFDEAHLLFDDASKEFLDGDRPDRAADPVQGRRRLLRHPDARRTCRATCWPSSATGCSTRCAPSRPDDAKALKATASTFPNSSYDLEEVLTQLGIGEAIVTVLSDRGAPTPVAWTRLRAPQSKMAPADPALLTRGGRGLAAAREVRRAGRPRLGVRAAGGPAGEAAGRAGAGAGGRGAARHRRRRAPRGRPEPEKSTAEKVLESSAFKQAARSAAAVLGREITRSIFGTRRR